MDTGTQLPTYASPPIKELLAAESPASVASEAFIKHMLMSLKDSLHQDFSNLIYVVQEGLQDHSKRLDDNEHKMNNQITAHKDLMDSESDQENKLAWLKNNIADLEDRSMCNNLKVRGVPESVFPRDLTKYLQGLYSPFLLSLSAF